VDDAGIARLLTPQGWELLQALPAYDEGTALALGERLRADGVDPDLAAAAVTQTRLRARATAKFGEFADGMLLTAAGLEQATRLEVAARHAQRFVAAGCTRVADLGCGLGGDAMAMAGLGLDVVAVDRDEATAAAATMNLRHWPGVRVLCAELADVVAGLGAGAQGPGAGADGAWLDPARRRPDGRRVLDPRAASPPWAAVLEVAARVPATGAKTAPGVPHDLLPHGTETCWTSVDGDVVEAAVWWGPLARPGLRRSALVLHGGRATTVDDAGLEPAGVGQVAAYLYDPDGAVVRSGLVARVAEATGGHLVDPRIAYVTADRLVRTPLARALAVEEVLPFGLKTLRHRLRERGVGRVEILKRGSAVDVEDLRRRLRLEGDGEASLVLTRVAGRQSVLICSAVG
jgi:SAM-dependent methyltransferase